MKNEIITYKSSQPPMVELDSEAQAAYIRISHNPVHRTEVIDNENVTVTADFDNSGDLVGIELIGVSDFSINTLLEMAGISPISAQEAARARYISAGQSTVI